MHKLEQEVNCNMNNSQFIDKMFINLTKAFVEWSITLNI